MMATMVTSTGTFGPPCFGKSPTSKSCRVSSGGATLRAALTRTRAIVMLRARAVWHEELADAAQQVLDLRRLGVAFALGRGITGTHSAAPPPRILTTSP